MFKDSLKRVKNIYRYLCINNQIQCIVVVQTHSTNVRFNTKEKCVIVVSINFTINSDTYIMLSFEMSGPTSPGNPNVRE